jgi:hypothetical protein
MRNISEPQLSPATLVVHCLVERTGDQWQAFSIEFGLAAQADTHLDASRKLEDMVRSYVYDALVGEDREHASKLLARKATFEVRAKYYWTLFLKALGRLFGKSGDEPASRGTYERPLPLTPTVCGV